MVSLGLVHIAKKLVGAEGLSVSVCGPISGCPADLTSPPPLIQPLAAADGHADRTFDSVLGGRNDRQARSMGPQTRVDRRSQTSSFWTAYSEMMISTTGTALSATEPMGHNQGALGRSVTWET